MWVEALGGADAVFELVSGRFVSVEGSLLEVAPSSVTLYSKFIVILLGIRPHGMILLHAMSPVVFGNFSSVWADTLCFSILFQISFYNYYLHGLSSSFNT